MRRKLLSGQVLQTQRRGHVGPWLATVRSGAFVLIEIYNEALGKRSPAKDVTRSAKLRAAKELNEK